MLARANPDSLATILVVEDDALFARVLTRFFTRYGVVKLARSCADARRQLEDPTGLGAVVLDVSLPDGNGLDLLEEQRDRLGGIPALVLTGHVDPDLINRAQRLRAEYACKPIDYANLEAFAARVVVHRSAAVDRAAVERWSRRYALSPRETELVAAVMSGTSRDELPRELGLSENTVKTHVRRILAKSGTKDLADLVRVLLKEGAAPP